MLSKTIISRLESYAKEADEDKEEQLTLNSLEARGFDLSEVEVAQVRMLSDGGASHNVYCRSRIPQGVVKKQVDFGTWKQDRVRQRWGYRVHRRENVGRACQDTIDH